MDDFFELMGKEHPDKMQAFHNFMQQVEKPGALDKKTKELIAISLSVKSQCAYCIDFHVKKALSMGITKQEIMEAAWVAVLMGGGPSFMYMQEVIKACD